MNDKNNLPEFPEGGHGRLRAWLTSIKEEHTQLINHPIYKEGWDEGYKAAQQNHKKLANALAKLYNIKN